MDMKELAFGELEAWCMAQERMVSQRPETITEGMELMNEVQVPDGESVCFTDGSWKEGDTTSGVQGRI
ncbi:unnamed protein product [Cochlearia groenlandica]